MDTSLQLDRWFKSTPGSMLASLEGHELSRLLPHFKGEFLIYCGGISDLSLVSSSPIPHRIHLSEGAFSQHPPVSGVQASIGELPFQENTLDVVVISHLLEHLDDPRQALAQVYRSLKPGGQIFLFGFNRLSIWGLERYRRQDFPWDGQFYTLMTARNWLRQLKFSIVSHKTLGFLPPLSKRVSQRTLMYWETVGQFFCPGLGGSYFIHAEKRLRSATLLIDRFREKRFVVGNQCPEATRVSLDV